MKQTDILVIGAGPSGISACLYLQRAGADFVWLEKSAPGGKLINIHEIGNYPGIPKVSGFDLAMALLKSTEELGVAPSYGEVKSVHKENNRFIVLTEEESYEAKAVIVATGLSNAPTISGEKTLLNKGVSYCATCDGPLYRGKEVAIYGKGDKALEEAIYLQAIASKVYIITNDEEYQGNALLKKTLKEKDNVIFIENATVDKIIGDNALSGIEYTQNKKKNTLNLSAVFPLLGEKSASAFLSPLNLENNRGFIKVDSNMISNCEGLFAAGDIVDKTLRQVVTAASDGAIAATSALSYVRRNK